MKPSFLLMAISIVAVTVSPAADPKGTTPPATKSAPAQAAPAASSKPAADEPSVITVKNKSSFNVDPGTRNPFWPISWKPAGKIASGADGEVPAGALLVTSITLDGSAHFAIINGKTMSEGQKFGLQIGTHIYQVEVKQIEDGRVILAHGSEEIVVPLRRK
jgi:hypothetical protein